MIDVQKIKTKFPTGTEVILLHMGKDPNPVPDYTRGKVIHVDDIGTIHVDFENNRALGVTPGVERIAKGVTWSTLREAMCEANAAGKKTTGYITFSNRSFTREYPFVNRTYEFSSGEKAFSAGATSNSIHGTSLDRCDVGVRLDIYMREWLIEACYLEEDF